MLSNSARRASLLLAGLLTLSAVSAYAQTLTGRISGTVTDSSGAAVAGASVIVTNTDTQAVRRITTDTKGFYAVEELPIGTYKVEVDSPGFKRSSQKDLAVTADARVSADFTLQVGELSETVSVVAHSETLNATSGEIAHVIDPNQVENLPLNGRNYMELLTLIPGATVTNPDQFSVMTSLSATNQTVNGHRSNQNSMTTDGLGNLDNGSNGSLINNLSPDFMQEVKIQTSNFSAEYGRSTGVAFNIATKNGTNTFHGSALEYFRNGKLDARNFFSPVNTPLHYNNFGYSLGGPVIRNKLFFFVGEEWKRLRQLANPVRETLPTTAELQGNFSDRLPGTKIDHPGTTTQYAGNIIPVSQLDPNGLAIANVYRVAQREAVVFNNSPVTSNATFEVPNSLNYREDIARLDYHINEKHTLYGRWAQDTNSIYLAFGPSSATDGSNVPITPDIRNRPAQSPLLSETWVISPNVVNEAHAGVSWHGQRYFAQGNTWQRTTEGFTFQRIFNSQGRYVNGIPDVSITSFAGFEGPDHLQISPTAEIEAGDTVSIVHGQHTIRTGFLMIRNRKTQNGQSVYDGKFSFSTSGNPNTTKYALSDALLGYFQTYTEVQYDPTGYYRYSEPAAFLDETWKASRRLSLNAGVRYEYYMTMYSEINNLSNFVPSLYNPAQAVKVNSTGQITGTSGNVYDGLQRVANGVAAQYDYLVPNAKDPAVLAVPDGGPRGLYPSHNTWAPRAGFAYALTDKTVVRGGFGLFYDRIQGNLTFNTLNNPPYVFSGAYANANVKDITTGAHAPFGTIQTINPNLKTPYSEQFSFGIQRQLPWYLFLETDYVGTLGRHLLVEPDINQPTFATLASVPTNTNENSIRPYPGYSTLQMFLSEATSSYHSLQVQLARRAGNALFTAAYTFSKALGNADSDTSQNKDYYNLYTYYGPLSYDASHVFSGSFVLSMPKLANFRPWLRAPLSNWQLSGTIHLQTGFPYTIEGNTSILGAIKADYVGGPVLLPNPGPNGWINKAAFKVAPDTRFGTAGAGDVRGPGLQTYNLSVARLFPILREGTTLQFRADFLNAFNTVNFQPFSSSALNVSDATFGTLTSAYPARAIQLSMKLRF